MKILIGVIAAQTLALGFVGAKLGALETSFKAMAETSRIAAEAPAAIPTFGAPQGAAGPMLSAGELRRIVREEVAAARGSAPQSPAPAPAARTAELTSALQSELNAHISRGSMNEADMAAFQLKIADLPPAQQKLMLSRLVKSINTGKLKAQL